MSIKSIAEKIRTFVAGRQAFIEVTIGPPVSSPLQLDNDTVAYPCGALGNKANIGWGICVLNELGIPTDAAFTTAAETQGAEFNHLTIVVYRGLSGAEYDAAAAGRSSRVDRYRALIGLYTCGEHIAILRIKWQDQKLAHAEFLPPSYRGIRNRDNTDVISPEFIKFCAQERWTDDQLHYFIGIVEQIHALTDQTFKIARYFSLLEAIAAPILSQFEKQGGKPTSRTAIRFMMGYFLDTDIPRFTIEPATDFEFDHIELAGRVRHKLFHGGGRLLAGDVTAALMPGLDLLQRRPDMISHWLRRDCELEIMRWARRESRAWLAANGTQYVIPPRNQSYDGRELTKPLITGSAQLGSAIASIFAKVVGGEIGLVRLHLEP